MDLSMFKKWLNRGSSPVAEEVQYQRTKLSQAELVIVLLVMSGAAGVIVGILMRIGGKS